MLLSYIFEMLIKRLIGLYYVCSFYHFSCRWEQLQHNSGPQGKLVSKQAFNLFERISAKNVSNSLIALVSMSSDFETFFVFNFLIIEAALSVLTFWKVKVLLDFFICSLIATIPG